jgi:hypothetical protein
MASEGRQGDPIIASRDEIDEILGRANPNPERIDCPSQDVLAALARRARPIEDPAYEHLAKCSPCYREFRSLQIPVLSQSRGASGVKWFAAAAILIVAIGAGSLFLLRDRGMSLAQVSPEGPQPTDVRTEVDLRRYTVTRSELSQADRVPLTLLRRRLVLTLLLPVGSEPGPYEIRVLDSSLQSSASATGEAAIRNYITSIETVLDLRPLSPGDYQLAVRRQGDAWQMFPARVE